MVEGVTDGRFDQAEVRSAVESTTLETEGIERHLLRDQCCDRVGELDFPATARPRSLEYFF